MGEIGRLTFIRRLDLATLYRHLVNFGSITPKFKKGKDVHPLVDQRFGYVVPLLAARPCGDQY